MSLKAKLEAVIYAAEEPVTLAQFAVLFAEEALALKVEQAELNLESATAEDEPEDSSSELSDLVAVVDGSADTEVALETAKPEAGMDSMPEAATEAAELEARRLGRLREREVREILRGVLDELMVDYASADRGIEIREIAGGFRMGTKPEIHDAVRAFVRSLKPPMKLSLPALETLAVIAYKQPVTSPEVGEIRGVDSAGVLGSLLSRKLIATAGRKQVIGRPILYKTTKEFLLRFGLKDLNELPSMEEFEKMAALELSESSLEEDLAGELQDGRTGDLFAESESATVPAAGWVENGHVYENDAPAAEAEADVAVTIPTAEPSEEAAAAQAPVERLDAEEVEASR